MTDPTPYPKNDKGEEVLPASPKRLEGESRPAYIARRTFLNAAIKKYLQGQPPTNQPSKPNRKERRRRKRR